MLFGYLPKEKVLGQADGFNPRPRLEGDAVSRQEPVGQYSTA
jgi:hypothetical protein